MNYISLKNDPYLFIYADPINVSAWIKEDAHGLAHGIYKEFALGEERMRPMGS